MQIAKQVLVTDVVARDGFQNEERIAIAGSQPLWSASRADHDGGV